MTLSAMVTQKCRPAQKWDTWTWAHGVLLKNKILPNVVNIRKNGLNKIQSPNYRLILTLCACANKIE